LTALQGSGTTGGGSSKQGVQDEQALEVGHGPSGRRRNSRIRRGRGRGLRRDGKRGLEHGDFTKWSTGASSFPGWSVYSGNQTPFIGIPFLVTVFFIELNAGVDNVTLHG
jgi:hypothetical protein